MPVRTLIVIAGLAKEASKRYSVFGASVCVCEAGAAGVRSLRSGLELRLRPGIERPGIDIVREVEDATAELTIAVY